MSFYLLSYIFDPIYLATISRGYTNKTRRKTGFKLISPPCGELFITYYPSPITYYQLYILNSIFCNQNLCIFGDRKYFSTTIKQNLFKIILFIYTLCKLVLRNTY